MAAPEGIKWGGIVIDSDHPNGRNGRIGVYIKRTDANDKSTVNVQIWFWTKYSCYDGAYNLLYCDVGKNVTSASTQVASNIDISHTVDTGSGWSTSNQTKLFDKTDPYTRGTSAVTYNVYAKFAGIDILDSSMYVNSSFTVPALPTYTISYDKNGGSTTPSSVTKYYGKNITVASGISRNGYKFKNWNTEKDGTGTSYPAGAPFSTNADTTLYAQWTPNTYTITFDANGGNLGNVSKTQTKTHDVTLKLDTDKPTRTNYTFLGWSTAKSSTVAEYQAGDNYTANNNVTLYAVWELAYVKPRISGFVVSRCLQNGTESDDGTYARVKFSWACDRTISSITIQWVDSAGNTSQPITVPASGTSGSVNTLIGGSLDVEKAYTIELTVRDTVDYSYTSDTLPSRNFAIDCLAGGNGVAFGKAAELPGYAEFGFNAVFYGGVRGSAFGLSVLPMIGENEDFNTYLTPGVYGVSSHAIAGTIANNPAGAMAGRLIVCAATGGEIKTSTWSYIQQWYIPMTFTASGTNAMFVRSITREPNKAANYYSWLKFTAVSV